LFPLFAAGVVDTGGKFTAGVVDTSSKFASGVIFQHLREFSEKFDMKLFSEAWWKMIHEKILKQKNLVTLSLQVRFL
jgi:hypothetical protein